MPVLPAVPSTMTPSERNAPRRSAHDDQGRAILDGLARVREFGLAQDGAAREVGGAAQLDQRRAADRVKDVVANGHARWPVDESSDVAGASRSFGGALLPDPPSGKLRASC